MLLRCRDKNKIFLKYIYAYYLRLEKMIKKFTRKVKKSGILDEVRERRHFTKKSVKRRLKRLSKKRNSQKSTEKMKERMEKYS